MLNQTDGSPVSVTVDEVPVTNTQVQAITVEGAGTVTQSSPSQNYVTFTIGTGATVATFTNIFTNG